MFSGGIKVEHCLKMVNSNSDVRISTGELSSLCYEVRTAATMWMFITECLIQRATVRVVTGNAGFLQLFLKRDSG